MVYFLLSIILATLVFGVLFWSLGLKGRKTGQAATLHTCSSGHGECLCRDPEGKQVNTECKRQQASDGE